LGMVEAGNILNTAAPERLSMPWILSKNHLIEVPVYSKAEGAEWRYRQIHRLSRLR